MTDLNHVVLIGNITRNLDDDERNFGYAANGQARANISIAVNRSKKQGEEWVDEVSYFEITVWGKTAENLKPYFVKGQKIAVDGYLKQDRWEKDGEKHSKISIVANTIQLVGNKKESENSSPTKNNDKPKFEPINQENNESFPEDIPF